MLLFTAVTLLTSPFFCQDYSNYAHSLLVPFVKSAIDLYSSDFIVYIVHGLIHLADDVKKHGSLDCFSAFPFENELKALKRLVRKGDSSLVQVIRRLGEHSCYSLCKVYLANDNVSPRGEHKRGHVPDRYDLAEQFAVLKVGQFTINVNRSPADCCIAVKGMGPVLVVIYC
jgi:hypothetical protein